MVVVPAALPVTFPKASTEAMTGMELVHAPPVTASLNVVVLPTQTICVPDMATGIEFTVTVTFTIQPVASVYETADVPASKPSTIPVVPMVATLALPLLHVPPVVASVSNVAKPSHTLAVPEIGDGNALTVTIAETDAQLPVL